MINHLKAFFFMAIAAPSAFAQTPLPVGTIIPESLTLTLGTPNAGNNLLTNLQEVTFREEFAGKAVMVVYHASW
ncbi:MAG: hypothetical protein QNL33_20005 [Akkermansiaceae bacterium]|jgi:hypothetical protein